MSQVTARLPEDLIAALDSAASALQRSRAEVIRQAVEMYLEDFDDLRVALQRLQDPADEVIDWETAKRALFPQN